MRLLTQAELLETLACPLCSEQLVSASVEACCTGCGRRYPCRHDVLDLVLTELLTATGTEEMQANAVDLGSDEAVERATTKDEWNRVYTAQMRSSIAKVAKLMRGWDESCTLVSLGSGAGFELKLLLGARRFVRVLSSDVAWSKSAVVPRTLSALSGELGLFASDFDRCPVRRDGRNVGLVFQALHHSDDAHRSLGNLLDRNFDRLIVVEPVTNWLVELLAKRGLAKRVEYSGVRPDWMELPKIRRLARERGYTTRAVTWWEIPPYAFPPWLEARPRLWRPILELAAGVSRLLGLFQFGSMAAVLFEAPQASTSR